jgi:chromosomal replication initiation ATPase DnaA
MKQFICPHCQQAIIPDDINNETLTLDEVIDVVLDHYGMDLKTLNKKDRSRPLVIVRQMICYVGRLFTSATFNEIGQKLYRDHTSVIHSIAVFQNLLSYDERIKADYSKVELLLKLLPETKRTYKKAHQKELVYA